MYLFVFRKLLKPLKITCLNLVRNKLDVSNITKAIFRLKYHLDKDIVVIF